METETKYVLKPETIELLTKVKQHILEEPKRFVMGSWARTKDDDEETYGVTTFYEDSVDQFIPFASCGTAACIGGWMVLLSDPSASDPSTTANNMDGHQIMVRARELLGMGHYGGETKPIHQLFFVEYWPEDLRTRWQETTSIPDILMGQTERTKIAGEVIDRFIETYKPKP